MSSSPSPEASSPSAPPSIEAGRWVQLARLIRLSSQTGTLLLLLPILWALVAASRGTPPVHLVVIFGLAAFLMRSAGVIVNDLADRSFDRQVARTKERPLASGRLATRDAVLVLVVLLAVAASLLLFLNPLTWKLSPIALLLALVYPFAKRYVQIPQLVLGLAFGWGAVMAWAAARGAVELPIWPLYAATACWALAYDTIYALQDREDDTRVGVKSSALFFGEATWIAVAGALGAMLVLLGMVGWLVGANAVFFGTLAAVAGFLTQQVRHLRGVVSPPQALAMFKQHVGVGFAILAGFWVGFL